MRNLLSKSRRKKQVLILVAIFLVFEAAMVGRNYYNNYQYSHRIDPGITPSTVVCNCPAYSGTDTNPKPGPGPCYCP